jgi:hypothetical protein
MQSVLDDAKIKLFVVDGEMSVLEGSANAIPRRVMVDKRYYTDAMRILKDAQVEVEGLTLFDE